MIQFISLAVDLINRYSLWLYAICVLVILAYLRVFLLSSRERAGTIFSLEREIGAQRQARALWSIGGVLAIMVAIAALRLYVIPSLDIEKMAEPTEPTPFAFFPTTEPPTPTPARVTPTATTRALPTLRRRTATPTPEPTVIPSPACPNATARITYPFVGMSIKGVVEIQGSANIPGFQFYKIEYGVGEKPDQWSSISDIHEQPVEGGLLGTWDTSSFPEGIYTLRLTVVEVTGNFPPPCDVRVVVQP